MKNHSPTLIALFLSTSLLATIGCSKEPATTTVTVVQPSPGAAPLSRPERPAPTLVALAPAAAETVVVVNAAPSPFTEMDAALAKATFEQHEGLSAVEQRMAREIDVQVTALKVTANVSLAAGEKLDSAKEDFAEKLRMLTLATVETWKSSKHDTENSLKGVQTAFAEIMLSPPKK